jgi:hypothetical protein
MHVLKLMIGLRLLDDHGASGRYIGGGRGEPASTLAWLQTIQTPGMSLFR